MGQKAERKKKEDRKNNRTQQKNSRGDSKVESNDSPEIPDRGETSDIPGLPSGGIMQNELNKIINKTVNRMVEFQPRNLKASNLYTKTNAYITLVQPQVKIETCRSA